MPGVAVPRAAAPTVQGTLPWGSQGTVAYEMDTWVVTSSCALGSGFSVPVFLDEAEVYSASWEQPRAEHGNPSELAHARHRSGEKLQKFFALPD
jgi:hypothetical protein